MHLGSKDLLFDRSSQQYDQRDVDDVKSYYVPFIMFGIFLAVCGVINVLFCDDFQYYFRFWVAILVSCLFCCCWV